MMRKIQSLQEVVLGKLVSYIQNNEVRMCSNSICKHTHTHTHTQPSKRIKDLNIRLETIKNLEENKVECSLT